MSEENIGEKIWQGDQTAIKEEGARALKEKATGNVTEYHTAMLSLYYSFFGKQNILKKAWWFILMSCHAFVLYKNANKLDHGQMNVLASFLMRLRLNKKYVFPETVDYLTAKSADMVVGKTKNNPSAEALALATRAKALAVLFPDKARALETINEALEFETLIKMLEKDLQSYRQFVRVLGTAAEIHGKFGDKEKQINYLQKALDWARNEADSQDQADKIQKTLDALCVTDK